MSINIEIQQKPKSESISRKVCNSNEVYNLKEVKEIKGAIQEHMLFIGLDNMNNIRNVTLLGIGNGEYAPIDIKEMIRLTLTNVCSKVILVHNHPSNSTEPTNSDCDITRKAYKLLRAFGIQLIDHIIVTEKEHVSIMKKRDLKNEIDTSYDSWEYLLLVEENVRLKMEVEELKNISRNKENSKDMNNKEENVKLPIGWQWNHYEDGSGCLKSPTGKKYFHYDWTTYEYKIHDKDRYSFFGNIDDSGNKITFEDFRQYAEKYVNDNLVNLPENQLENDIKDEESEDEL